MKRILITVLLALSGITAEAQTQIDTIYVSNLFSTHLIFATEIKYADVSNPGNISAMIVEEYKNILAMKARAPFEECGSVTAVESNGLAHVYILKYQVKPAQLIWDIRGEEAQQEYRMKTTAEKEAERAEQEARARQARTDEWRAAPDTVVNVIVPTESGLDKYLTPSEKRRLEKRRDRTQKDSIVVATTSVAVAAPVAAAVAPKEQKAQEPRRVTSSSPKDGVMASSLKKRDAPLLRDVADYPQELFHIATKNLRVEFVCENIFAYSDITYITLRLTNTSGVSYEVKDAMFTIEDSNRSKHKVKPEPVTMLPSSRYGSLTTAPAHSGKAVYSFSKITLGRDQVLKIYLYEKGGQRNMSLTLTPEDVNLASIPGGRQ